MITIQKSYPAMLLEKVHEAYHNKDIARLTAIEETITSLIYNAKMHHIKEDHEYTRIGIKVRQYKDKLRAKEILPYLLVAYFLKTYFT